MKTLLMVSLVLLVSCSKRSERAMSTAVVVSSANLQAFLKAAKDKQMYTRLMDDLDLSAISKITAAQAVEVFMVAYKNDPTKIYAVNSLGSELLYAAQMKDDKNGSIGLMKSGEAIIIEFNNGIKNVKALTHEEFETKFAGNLHGGTGFCQRQAGESFRDCFNAEANEFCDSFVSCVALATQPSVAIVIGLACSCNSSNKTL